MRDSNHLIVSTAIQTKLEIMGGLPLNSTSLHQVHSGYPAFAGLLWQVGNRYIRMPPIDHADLRMPLDEFAAKYCTEPVRVMKEGDGA